MTLALAPNLLPKSTKLKGGLFGNAVIPQIPEILGNMILEAEKINSTGGVSAAKTPMTILKGRHFRSYNFAHDGRYFVFEVLKGEPLLKGYLGVISGKPKLKDIERLVIEQRERSQREGDGD